MIVYIGYVCVVMERIGKMMEVVLLVLIRWY